MKGELYFCVEEKKFLQNSAFSIAIGVHTYVYVLDLVLNH